MELCLLDAYVMNPMGEGKKVQPFWGFLWGFEGAGIV